MGPATICFGLIVMVCEPMGQPAKSGADYCSIAKPLRWSANDTRKSKEQMDTHNRVWKRLCGGKR